MDGLEIVWWLVEIVLELAGDLFFELGAAVFDSLDASARDALIMTILLFVAGACVGLLSAVVLPDRLLPRPRTPGYSLFLAPLASGYALHAWGTLRRERGYATSPLATFHGGAAFALGSALGRFFLLA